MKRIALCACAILLTALASAQTTYLRVQHPQQTWRYGTGTINDATMVLHPRGSYLQCDFYLLFSAKGLGFAASDSVEIQFDFQLPSNAIVTDLWLWVDDQIMRGLIMDRWTASSIYESIVKRRRDPCLLTKGYTAGNWTSYAARIYPLAGTGTRRIMISYLVPMSGGGLTSQTALAAHVLKASKNGPPMLRVRYFQDEFYNDPRLLEYPTKPFEVTVDSLLGPVLQVEVPGSLQIAKSQMTLSVARSTDSPVLLSRFKRGNEGFYSVSVIPSRLLSTAVSRHLVIAIDYDSLATSLRQVEICETLREGLKNGLTGSDSLVILYHGSDGVVRTDSGWTSGSAADIDAAFARIASRPLSGKSHLKDLLLAGGAFLNGRGGRGAIGLVTASVDYTDPRTANVLLADLADGLGTGIPVHVVDFATPSYKWVYLDGKSYYNNDYFLVNITRRTGGSYHTRSVSSAPSYASLVSGMVQNLSAVAEAMDLQTTVEGGLCAARYTVMQSEGGRLMDAPIVQVGKYYGSFPFVVQVTALFQGGVVSGQVRIDETASLGGDSSLAQIWAGAHIKWLESQGQTNDVIRQTIDLSIRERVLSMQTAFLALEPNDSIRACLTCRDESGGITGILEPREKPPQDSLVVVYPNPFNTSTVLSVRLPDGIQPEQASLRIFNVIGQVVKTLDASRLNDRTGTRLNWDGKNESGNALPSGMYLFVMTTPRGKHVTKLMLVK